MHYAKTSERLANYYRQQIAELRHKMKELQRSVEPEEVGDYEFSTVEGAGFACPSCSARRNSCSSFTIWAPPAAIALYGPDGFNGIFPHIENRAAFIVASPDEPAAQQKFKATRGWRFRLVSYRTTDFARDMGYWSDDGWLPGVSVLHKSGQRICRISDAGFQPGDDFCAVWHFFELLPEGAGGWQPQYKYQ